MDYNFWFYTLSAIPQTLAAIIAFFGTFVVFKLNQVHSLLERNLEIIKFFLYPLFPEKEFPDIENLDDKSVINLLDQGIKIIKPEEDRLGLGNNIYCKLAELYKELIIQPLHRKYPPRKERIYGFLLHKSNILNKIIKFRKETISDLMLSLFLNLLPIIFSLFLLPNYDLFAHSKGILTLNLSEIILSVVIAFSIVATSFSIYLIHKIIKFR